MAGVCLGVKTVSKFGRAREDGARARASITRACVVVTAVVFATLAFALPVRATAALGGAYPGARARAGARTRLWAENVPGARSIVSAGGEFIVLERGTGSVVLLYDDNDDGYSDASERVTLVTQAGLNHGVDIAWSRGFLFASDADNVWRWPIVVNSTNKKVSRSVITAAPTKVVRDISRGTYSAASGTTAHGHSTRTLVVNEVRGELYIQVGSVGNVDEVPYRAAIRKMSLDDAVSTNNALLPFDYRDLKVLASGIRNTVGLALDPYSLSEVMYGVDNGPDNARYSGQDVHNDNPGEEVNRFVLSHTGETFYGYPFCMSEFSMPTSVGGMGRGTQFVWSGQDRDFSGLYSDAWCRNASNQLPPIVSMQAHSAPLGIEFVDCASYNFTGNRSLPCSEYDGWAFVAFHGSWNRRPATGYKIVALPFESKTNRTATGEVVDIVSSDGPGATWATGLRPVDVALDSLRGRLMFTSDSTGEILVIESATPSPSTPNPSTPNPPTPNPSTPNPSSAQNSTSSPKSGSSTRRVAFVTCLLLPFLCL